MTTHLAFPVSSYSNPSPFFFSSTNHLLHEIGSGGSIRAVSQVSRQDHAGSGTDKIPDVAERLGLGLERTPGVTVVWVTEEYNGPNTTLRSAQLVDGLAGDLGPLTVVPGNELATDLDAPSLGWMDGVLTCSRT